MAIDLRRVYISLNSIEGIGAESISNAYKKCETLTYIFDFSKNELMEAGFNEKQASLIKNKEFDESAVENEIELIEKNNIIILTIENSYYPKSLLDIYSPPSILYFKGNLNALKKPAVAVVGSRKASQQSKEFTAKISKDLAEAGFNVVSGLAYGIDLAAHSGSVKTGSTTAVLGSGLLNIYPQQHIKYVDKICEQGCIISELPLYAEPLAANFPRRNRIVSGMSMGVLVVEAQPKSGSLITAKYAMEQGKEVFAVPTFPSNYNSLTNSLIKDGAKLTENYLDIIEELDIIPPQPKNIDKGSDYNIVNESPFAEKVFEILIIQPMTLDEICLETGIDTSELMVLLSELELDGHIVKDADGRYRATGE